MVTDEAEVWPAAPGSLVKYARTRPVEFLPWIRSERLETHVLITDLVHGLGEDAGPVSGSWRAFLEAAAAKPTVVDQYTADGLLVARHSKRFASNDIWRLSLGRGQGDWECGLLVLSGRRTLCHFQVVGEQTFATCHARRLPLEQPPKVQRRWVPFPQQPGLVLSLLLMNTGEGVNRITLSRVAKDGAKDYRWKGGQVDIPRLGSRLVRLNEWLPQGGEAERCEFLCVESSHPYDFYTIIENGLASDATFSIQHVK